MDIRAALDRIVVIQKGLTITAPIPASVKQAYKYMAPQTAVAPDCPCFMNSWTLVNEERGGGLRIQNYVVHMQLFVEDSDQDVAADIASAFHVALVDAFDQDVKLAGTINSQSLRGGSPTLVLMERASRAYIGLDLFLDLVLKDAVAFA